MAKSKHCCCKLQHSLVSILNSIAVQPALHSFLSLYIPCRLPHSHLIMASPDLQPRLCVDSAAGTHPKTLCQRPHTHTHARNMLLQKGGKLTCSMRSTWRVMETVMPKSSSRSRDESLAREQVLTMLLRRARARLYSSWKPEGLLGSSKPPLLLLAVAAAGGDLGVLPCTTKTARVEAGSDVQCATEPHCCQSLCCPCCCWWWQHSGVTWGCCPAPQRLHVLKLGQMSSVLLSHTAVKAYAAPAAAGGGSIRG